jgi:predicted aconitase with swiveling domain
MRAKIAPAAIVLAEPDGVICTGVLVGQETYNLELPVIQVPISALNSLKSGLTGKVVSQEGQAFLRLS